MKNTIKLKSGSKYIPVNSADTVVVGVNVYKSINYTGSYPRLILKNNASSGSEYTVLGTFSGSNNLWETQTFELNPATNNGYCELYVDCSGVSGSGSINVDGWTLSYGGAKYWYSSTPTSSGWWIKENWYSNLTHTISANILPSSKIDVVLLGTNGSYIDLDRSDWVEPKSITTGTANLSVHSGTGKTIRCNINGSTVIFTGDAVYNK